MPNKPLRPCRHPGCRTLTSVGYCDQHKPRRSAQELAWRKFYRTQVWRILRTDQLLREPMCRECGARATDVDHITPHRGDWQLFVDKNNLESLCHRCHSRKTLAEIKEKRGDFRG